MNRGMALEETGHTDKAIADLKKALEVAPPDWPHRRAVEDLVANRTVALAYQEGCRLIHSGSYREAIEKLKRVVESHPATELGVNSAYNIACGYALLGEKSNALDWLEKAVEMGWKDAAQIEKDSDLDSLRSEERYKKIVARLKGE
jgi:tetratricopeptide (TPR) repeat protein